MSDVIRLLPDHVANQIAAGEVVQRPASIVKELVENAIDAGATKIHLIIKEAGRQLVQVIDDGVGMSVTDARMAFERHATSKISTTDDIFHIHTKGFRGEALASIAAVAQVELKTKTVDSDVGTLIRVHGGTVKAQEPTVTTEGTSISVSNLFYNVPARRNFLKSNSVEFRHIMDEFHRVALAHENIDFKLEHNGNEIFSLIKTHLAQRILHIFGKKLEGQLIPLQEETDVVKISGFIGKPQIAKKVRGEQFFFVNHRYIRNGYLHKALQNAFDNLIASGQHPTYFIFLEIDPEKIDINIHPTKTEIKFEDEATIYAQLRAATKHALGQYQVTPAINFDQPDWDIPIPKKKVDVQAPNIHVDKSYNPFKAASQPSTFKKEPATVGGNYDYYELESATDPNPTIFSTEPIQDQNVLLQWQNAYIITTFAGDLICIDQHRAHQSVLYHSFLQKSSGNTLSQQLLFPIHLPLTTTEVQQLKTSEHYWISFGFDMTLEEEGAEIKAIPGDLAVEMVIPLFSDFLSADLALDEMDFTEILSKFMAKAAAVKKGTKLSHEKLQHLVQQLFALEQFNYSPFGKRIYQSFTLAEMKKMLD